jgi:alcohol dehydrogenase class IV
VNFHVPHGMSNAMLLPTITEYSLPGAPLKYAECAMHMGLIANIEDEALAHQILINELKQINQILEVPTLAQFGVEKAQYDGLLANMAEQALASGSPGNNPKIPTLNDIIELYRKVWD